jgi:hypothetical protein
MMMIVVTEGREKKKKTGFGPIKKISRATNTKKITTFSMHLQKKDEVCT